jgi:dTDP-glucose pyrophosphorylase
MITLALCMAGHGRRFQDAGYAVPKYLLPLQGQPILAHVVAELRADRLLLVANRRDERHADTIAAIAPDAILRFIGDTRGQAETAAYAARAAIEQGWGADPFAVHNVDTILYGRDLKAIASELARLDGYIDTFSSDDPAYRYVRTADDGRVTEIAEKVVISSLATSGFYGFRTPGTYLEHAAAADPGPGAGPEFYVSDVYARMLRAGCQVGTPAAPQRVTVIGTPLDYDALLSSSADSV